MKTRQNPSLRDAHHTGMTVIELLSAVLVLSVLVALIFPTFTKAVESGKQSACLQNLRTFGAGTLSLISEGSLPYWDGKPGGQMADGSTYPDFYEWLVDGEYIPGERKLRCPKASGRDRERTLGMQYGANSAFCIYFNRNPMAIPFPQSRVVLAAEAYSAGFNIPGHLNRTIWANDSAAIGPEVEGTAKDWPTPQFHGSKEKRGLNLFFLDGHVQFVQAVDNDWRKEPIYGANDNQGYIYDRDQMRRIKAGTLRP